MMDTQRRTLRISVFLLFFLRLLTEIDPPRKARTRMRPLADAAAATVRYSE
jgi:hypothetical protein